ncbi:MAG TPA: ATP-binding cassette domain-containing protein [Opitutus sp.]|nr:ATP-binding cassette domain-containing protein [Opitutus sp.]
MSLTSPPLISVRGLRHTFGEGAFAREVLHGIDVDFAPGEIAMIMGHSGSGKTTFLTLMSALRETQAGSVRLDGRELRGASAAELTDVRRSIGFVFQRHNLLGALTARQNVQMALLLDQPENSTEAADALLARVGLAGHEHKRPHELSVGQQQRVAIARALARRPRVIMADEPTASLDAETGREVIQLMQSLARTDRCAVLIVTHDARILDVADRILELDDGHLVATDVAFERMLDETAAQFAELPRVFELPAGRDGAEAAELAELRRRFAAATETLNVRASDHVRMHLRAELARRADALQQLLGAMRAFEGVLAEFCAQLAGAPEELRRGVGDALRQSLETVVLTTGDALRTRTAEDIAILRGITSDRSDVMKRVRDAQFGAAAPADEERRAAGFALTNDFARAIYLLGQIARFLELVRTE